MEIFSFPYSFIYKFDPLVDFLVAHLDFFDFDSQKSDQMSFSSNVLLRLVGFFSDLTREFSQDFLFHFLEENESMFL